MVTIIMTVRYRPDLVRVCLDCLFQYTDEEFKLIVVEDGTPGYEKERTLEPRGISKRSMPS